ncbi:glyceraldehyde-3-phosphate dehydrogenase [Pseudophaeobacter sp.]
MTPKIATWLGLLLITGIAADLFATGGDNLIFLGKKLFELMEWVAFWR